MNKFQFKELNDVVVEEEYHVKTSNICAVLENLDDDDDDLDINRACKVLERL
jgi:hypothetical protein